VYADGQRAGLWKSYREGKLREETTYVAGNRHGKEIIYGDDDKPMAIAHWDHGKRHGVFEYWHAGKLLATTTMEHDTGDWVEYRVDRLIAKGRLVKDVREGPWELDGHGEFLVGTFVAGKRNGRWTIYEDDRKTKTAEGEMKDDKRRGAWTLWRKQHDDKEVVGKGTYDDDKLDGAWQIFVDGELVQRLGFKKGILATVDGKRASKKYLNGYAMRPDFPAVIEESDMEPYIP
jgi:antitoxin component YwqK of YwqJK toxin-antitoxin module